MYLQYYSLEKNYESKEKSLFYLIMPEFVV